ncbi:MAG: aminotransferase class V-fold PLP-dependent enzyme [Opitutales bacterium]
MNRKSFLRGLGAGALGLAGGAGLRGQSPTASPASGPRALPPAGDPRFWQAVKASFAIEPGLTYFNTGGLGPASLPVRREVDRVQEHLQDTVSSGHGLLNQARPVAAAFVGAEVDEIAFTRNATESNGIIAGGLSLKPGDEVIFESHAHPGGSFSWLLQARLRGICVKVFEPDPHDPAGNLAAIEALATPRTRVVQVSHVTAPTGIHLPVREIAALCRRRGWWFHVDGAQTLGMFPFSLHDLGVDSYASSGHKWLCGPHETGLLYIRRDRLEDVAPIVAGAYTADLERLPGELELTEGAARHEYGTRNAALVAGFEKAIAFQQTIGPERIADRGLALADRFLAGLDALPEVEVLSPREPSLRSPMVALRSPRIGYRELFGELLGRHRLRCRPVSEQGLDALRVSFHFFNTAEEVDTLLGALEEILREAA